MNLSRKKVENLEKLVNLFLDKVLQVFGKELRIFFAGELDDHFLPLHSDPAASGSCSHPINHGIFIAPDAHDPHETDKKPIHKSLLGELGNLSKNKKMIKTALAAKNQT